MARVQCRACGYDGDGDVGVVPTCPRCGSTDCRAAVSVADLPEDFVERLGRARASDVRDDLAPQWRSLFDAFVAAGHVPATRRSGAGVKLDDEWRDEEGRQVGIQCSVCGYGHRLGHAHALPVLPCDGHEGKVARLAERADRARATWLRAEALAREATTGAPPGFFDPTPRETLAEAMERNGVADADDTRGWEAARRIALAWDLLATVPEGRVPALDLAMRVLAIGER